MGFLNTFFFIRGVWGVKKKTRRNQNETLLQLKKLKLEYNALFIALKLYKPRLGPTPTLVDNPLKNS